MDSVCLPIITLVCKVVHSFEDVVFKYLKGFFRFFKNGAMCRELKSVKAFQRRLQLFDIVPGQDVRDGVIV